MEVSARPCELPLAFDAFSQTYQAPPRREGDLLWIRVGLNAALPKLNPVNWLSAGSKCAL